MAHVRAFAALLVLALAGAAVAQIEVADPCVAAQAECRDVICAGRQVVSNHCEFHGTGMSKSCACAGGEEGASLGGQAQAKPAGETEEEGMDCDDMAEMGQEEEDEQEQEVFAMPMRLAFGFGRRFGPQEGVMRVSRPAFGIGGLFDSDDSQDSPVSSLGMLINVIRARQALLQQSPSFVTRRVYYPGQGAVAFQITTASDDEEGQQRISEVAAMRHGAEEAARERAFHREDPEHHQHHRNMGGHGHGHHHAEHNRLAPRAPIRLDAAPAPARADVDVATTDVEIVEGKEWYNGYHARRALYCVASILLILGVLFLNAALLMCCVGESAEEAPEIDVDVVADSTPLLVEYDVHKSSPPKVVKEGQQMVIVHELMPLPPEGKCGR